MTKDQEYQLRKQAVERGYNPQQVQKFIEFAKGKEQAPTPSARVEEKPKSEGFLKSLIKDPVKTLIVKPGVRIAQAGVGLYAKAKNDTQLLDRTLEEQNIKLPGLGNFQIEGQRSGVSGAKQIAGDAAKTASYLFTPGAGKAALKTGLTGAVKQGALQGAKAGAVGGGLFSGGQALQEDKSFGQVAKDTAIGAGMGLAAGAVLGGGTAAVAKGVQKASSAVREATKTLRPNAGLGGETQIIANRQKELAKLENSYSILRKKAGKAAERGIDIKKVLAETDLLQNAVDDTGTIRTQNAISDLNDFIKPQEDVISKNLQKEGKRIPLGMVEAKLKASVNASGLKGGAKLRALRNVADDIEGYALEIDKDGYIPVSIIHDAKVDKYANINYMNPESKRADKAIARGLKELIEEHTGSVDVKTLNDELARHYALQSYLEALDGKKVDGGKLGKYFAQTIGSIVGSHFGPLGTIVGAEVGGRIRGAQMSTKFNGRLNKNLEQSAAMKAAVERGLDKVIRLP